LLRLGRAHGWPQDVLEDLAALVVQAHAISQTPMARAEDVIVMSAYFRASDTLWSRIGDSWTRIPEADRGRWSPEAGTLGVAARARETRRSKAWVSITG